MIERTVKYFDKPGPVNTQRTIEAARDYLKGTDEISALVVASISGETALKVRKELTGILTPIVCVTGAPCWQNYPGYESRRLTKETWQKLKDVNVPIVDSVPSSLSDTIEFSYARYGFRSPTWMVVETLLAIGGYGLKTAVECVLMATDGGHIPPFKKVIAIAGTDKGADTAIVAHSTFSINIFSSDPKKRFIVYELLAMPQQKIFYKGIDVGEWHLEELKDKKE